MPKYLHDVQSHLQLSIHVCVNEKFHLSQLIIELCDEIFIDIYKIMKYIVFMKLRYIYEIYIYEIYLLFISRFILSFAYVDENIKFSPHPCKFIIHFTYRNFYDIKEISQKWREYF